MGICAKIESFSELDQYGRPYPGPPGGFPPGMRGMRPPQGAGYPPQGMGGPPGPGTGFPPGQYPGQRHPGQPYMDPMARAQV